MTPFLRPLLAILAFAIAAASAQAAERPLWLRDPAISPDGTRIAFRYRGQIWTVPADGGEATALTPAGIHAATPVWSPDGKRIAFSADRFGRMNVYVVDADGGEARRLTWYSADERPTSFTPDGKAVLFTSSRLGSATETFARPHFGEYGNQLYQVPVEGGRETLVLPNASLDARWDAAGRRLLYTSASIEQHFRQHQTSSAARQVWLYAADTGVHQRLTGGVHESRDAVWSPTGDVYYLGEDSGSLNVWCLSLDDRSLRQVTRFTGDPVRSLSMARTGDIAFAQDGAIWRLRHGADAPERIDVHAASAVFAGESANRASSFSEIALSPTGREVALVINGDIFVASISGRHVKRVTRTPGEERSPLFSPDGRRLAYAAERDGHWILVEAVLAEKDETTFAEATRIEEKPIRLAAEDAMLPVYSPDGTRLAYVANRESVRVVTPADGRDVEVLPKGLNYSYADGTWWLSWSPDGKWIAAPVQVRYGTTNVAVVTAEGGAPPVRVSPSGEFQALAQWSADGAVLYWANIAGSGVEVDGVFTSRAARDEFGRKLRSEAPPEAPPPAPPANGDARANPGKSRPVHPFEPNDIDARGLRLTTQPSGLIAFGLMDDGVSVLTIEMSQSAQSDGSVLSGEVRDLRLQSRKTLFSGLPFVSLLHGKGHAAAAMSRDHKKLYLTAPDGLIEVDIQKGTSRVIRIAADVAQDQSELRRAAFEQFWTLTKKKFFDPGMNGVDWDAAHARYERFLPHLADPRDLAELLSEMAGELNASHTAGRYRTVLPAQDTVASLGLIYDDRYPGPGMKVAEILPGGPFDAADGRVKPGDIIREIDGVAVPDNGGLARLLRGRARDLIAVTIEGRERFTERRVAISLEQETELATRRWVNRKRELVAAKSCGRLGYIYVPAMDGAAYRKAVAEIFGRYSAADALIVDVRFNGGGNLHNQLLTLLSGKPYMTMVPPRGGPLLDEPRDRWSKPSAVVMNASSYSDASVFPQAYKDLKLGPLVGDPVAGTGTFVWWVESNLIPGLVYGLPQLPVRKLDGHLMENADVIPDIAVPSDPTAWANGEDPQLDAAVRTMMTTVHASCDVAGKTVEAHGPTGARKL